MGLWRSKVEDFGQVEAIDLLHEMKMSVSSVHWAGGFTGGDGRSFNSAIEDAKDAIRLTSAVTANCLILHPGSRNFHTAANASRLINKALESLVPYASDFDVSLAIEPMCCGSCRQWTFVDNFKQTVELISRHPSQVLGIVLDLFHVGLSQEFADELPNLSDRIKLVQIADKNREIPFEDNRCPLGSGCVPIAHWLTLLSRLGYGGPYEIELHGFDMEGIEYSQMLQDSHRFVDACISNSELMNSGLADTKPKIEFID